MREILLALFIVMATVLLTDCQNLIRQAPGGYDPHGDVPIGYGHGGYGRHRGMGYGGHGRRGMGYGGHGHMGMGYGGYGHMGYGGYRRGGYGHRGYGPIDNDGSDNLNLVDRRPAPRLAAGPICPNNLRRHYCYVNPCRGARCMSHPQYTCVPDYCGGCKRTWRDTNGEDVDCPSYNIAYNYWSRNGRRRVISQASTEE